MKIVLIVPTKDRPEDLTKLFESIRGQTRKPDLVIIVDGSDHPILNVVEKYQNEFSTSYIACRPPSLPKQRNAGIAAVPADADWVGFLDDDLVLELDALEGLEKLIQEKSDPRLKGISLSILNQPSLRVRAYMALFLMASAPGRLTLAGYPTAIPCIETDIETDWLYGGATFWARDILETFKFDEWFFGTGYMEDIDFSYTVSRRFKLMVTGKARCRHYSHDISLAKQASIGEWQLTSWWYFIRKHRDFSLVFVMWGMFGLVLKNILAIFVFRTAPHVERAKGHARGLFKILTGRAFASKGFSK